MEFPIEFFMTFAWDPQRWPKEKISEYTKLWAQREFGPKYADDIADIVAKYTKYNARRKPELVDANTFSIVNYNEADNVVADWNAITIKAEQIYSALPDNAKDAFFQLVLYPTKASAIVTELYVTAAKNDYMPHRGGPRPMTLPRKPVTLFKADAELIGLLQSQSGQRQMEPYDGHDPISVIHPGIRRRKILCREVDGNQCSVEGHS